MLVDIMMPDMDGYETIREIRAMEAFRDLPIVAVTAKAMKGDRQKCIQAGASDYVSKPVDIDHLISVLRVSIQRADSATLASDGIQNLLPAGAERMGRLQFRCPLRAGPAGAAGPIFQGEAEPRARILIVDDDERNAFAAGNALEGLGCDLVVARSGEEALKRLLVDDFAVILLDLHMPGMDGYETAELIRARRRSRDTPIVFLTAVFRDEAHLFQAYSAGAVDVVFKPVDPFILRSKVSILVDLHLKTEEVRRQAEAASACSPRTGASCRRSTAPSGRCSAARSGRRRS